MRALGAIRVPVLLFLAGASLIPTGSCTDERTDFQYMEPLDPATHGQNSGNNIQYFADPLASHNPIPLQFGPSDYQSGNLQHAGPPSSLANPASVYYPMPSMNDDFQTENPYELANPYAGGPDDSQYTGSQHSGDSALLNFDYQPDASQYIGSQHSVQYGDPYPSSQFGESASYASGQLHSTNPMLHVNPTDSEDFQSDGFQTTDYGDFYESLGQPKTDDFSAIGSHDREPAPPLSTDGLEKSFHGLSTDVPSSMPGYAPNIASRFGDSAGDSDSTLMPPPPIPKLRRTSTEPGSNRNPNGLSRTTTQLFEEPQSMGPASPTHRRRPHRPNRPGPSQGSGSSGGSTASSYESVAAAAKAAEESLAGYQWYIGANQKPPSSPPVSKRTLRRIRTQPGEIRVPPQWTGSSVSTVKFPKGLPPP
ncbi:hypothetical protein CAUPRSCDRAFT_10955 [Caulochytrium protostelioides]|uniref:Uncharacterized protein n=1 Tax=Caulochytrium protostelioides TaxID=1555241 RepID=A0A4P9WVF1_9FUNG|nr:hypothetical protein CAUPRSCDRAFT_10955 [Caulochytrium protostelioides]